MYIKRIISSRFGLWVGAEGRGSQIENHETHTAMFMTMSGMETGLSCATERCL